MGSGSRVPQSLIRKSLLKGGGSTDFAQITNLVFSLSLSPPLLTENFFFFFTSSPFKIDHRHFLLCTLTL